MTASGKERQALLSLLRAGLWESAPDSQGLFPLTAAQWSLVRSEARRQTVTGLVFRGFCRLPDELQPPEEVLLPWLADVDAAERRSRRMNADLKELCALFRGHGLNPVLLKGQAIAACYEEPLLRECGDIDLYFSGKDFGEARRVIESLGSKVSAEADGSLCYSYHGTVVEHHPCLTDLRSPLTRRFRHELEDGGCFREVLLSPDGKAIAATADGAAENNGNSGTADTSAEAKGTAITVPAPQVTLLLLSSHILKHLFYTGIGLRQFCDMARACHCLTPQVDRTQLRELFCKAGIGRWGRRLYAFMRSNLALPPECDIYFAKEAAGGASHKQGGLTAEDVGTTQKASNHSRQNSRHGQKGSSTDGGDKNNLTINSKHHSDDSDDALLRIIFQGGNFGFGRKGRDLSGTVRSRLQTGWLVLGNSLRMAHLAPGEALGNVGNIIAGQFRRAVRH